MKRLQRAGLGERGSEDGGDGWSVFLVQALRVFKMVMDGRCGSVGIVFIGSQTRIVICNRSTHDQPDDASSQESRHHIIRRLDK